MKILIGGAAPSERDPQRLYVKTGRESMLVFSVEGGDVIHRLNADHVRRWAQAHRNGLLRLSQDHMAKRYMRKRGFRALGEARDVWCRKQRARLDSFTHEASACIAGLAARRNVSRVVYDDSERGYVDPFPWAELEDKIKYKLEERGIALEKAASASAVNGSPQALAESENA